VNRRQGQLRKPDQASPGSGWKGGAGVAVRCFLAYALFVGFFFMELFVRLGAETKDMSRTAHDKGSTTLVSIAMGIAFIAIPLAPLFNYLGVGTVLGWWAALSGVGLGALGLVIRYLAFTTLGRFFTRTLRETAGQTLVTSGVYRHIRHPGYLSDLLIFIGASLAMGNLIVIVSVIVLFAVAYSYRIHVEEGMLQEIFGERYVAYQRTSRRLIPFVF
jgi:protein-S-isoprenylcysteine O-methyltransferase Ste14